MNHLKWMGHSATILDIHKNLRADLQSCEVKLIAKGHTVKAHRFVLSACSDLLRNLLSDIPLGQDCSIMMPDIKGHLLDSVLAFIYLGECSLSSSNLSEFLEAINVLGIKSAISFECNTNALQAAQHQQQQQTQTNNNALVNSATPPANSGALDGGSAIAAVRHVSSSTNTGPTQGDSLQQEEELLETQTVLHADTQTVSSGTNVLASDSGSSRELEFLDVYHEPEHKITYSIEHVPGSTGGNEFILTENSGTFTLTQHNHKLETNSSGDSTNMEVTEDEACESHIIEEYSSGEEPLITIADASENTAIASVSVPIQTASVSNATTNSTSIIEIKPKIKTVKLKSHITSAPAVVVPKIERIRSIDNYQNTSEHITMLHAASSTAGGTLTLIKDGSANESFGNSTNESSDFTINTSSLTATDMAYQAMFNEGISLPKAAVKFNVSKAELWSRVRKSGVENLHKSPKLDPEKLDVIEMASQAVISEGLSLQKAAVRYDISKTVLWRRVRKHPQYMKTTRENPIISKAYERLKTGESLKSISQDLDIPMSTLHRHKVRLSQTGQLPDFVTCKKRDSMSKDDLKMKLAKAVHACVHEGMSQNHAANLFEISKSTLWRHLQRRVAEAEAADARECAVDESMGEEDIIKEEVILS